MQFSPLTDCRTLILLILTCSALNLRNYRDFYSTPSALIRMQIIREYQRRFIPVFFVS